MPDLIRQGEGDAGDREDDEEPAQRGAEDIHHGLHDIFNSFGNILSSVSDAAFDKLVPPLASPPNKEHSHGLCLKGRC